MTKTLSLLFIAAVLGTSCKKSNDQIATTPQTPLDKVLDKKYIRASTADNAIDIDFAAYKANEDCDKAVFNATLSTIQGSYNIDKVTINGATLIMTFDRKSNVQPASLRFVNSSPLYLATHKEWPYSGFLRISKLNSFLTKDQFEQAINVKVRAVNTGDEAQIIEKYTGDNLMTVEYKLTKSNPLYSQSMYYEVQAATPVTLRSQITINCLIPGFIEPQNSLTIDLDKAYAAPLEKDLGNNVKSYYQELYASWVTTSLSNYIASRYFVEKVYPKVQ